MLVRHELVDAIFGDNSRRINIYGDGYQHEALNKLTRRLNSNLTVTQLSLRLDLTERYLARNLNQIAMRAAIDAFLAMLKNKNICEFRISFNLLSAAEENELTGFSYEYYLKAAQIISKFFVLFSSEYSIPKVSFCGESMYRAFDYNYKLFKTPEYKSATLCDFIDEHSKLEILDMSAMQLTDDAAPAIVAAITRSSNLKEVVLHNNCFTLKGAAQIIKAAAYKPNLCTIDLENNALWRSSYTDMLYGFASRISTSKKDPAKEQLQKQLDEINWIPRQDFLLLFLAKRSLHDNVNKIPIEIWSRIHSFIARKVPLTLKL